MIKAKVKNGNVTVRTEGHLADLAIETVITMSAIFNSIQRRDPEAAEVFKDIVEFAVEHDMVWNFCDGGNGK